MNIRIPTKTSISTKPLDGGRTKAITMVLKRGLLALAIVGVGATSSGCLWVRDDQGNHHWRWNHDHDHDVPPEHHDAP